MPATCVRGAAAPALVGGLAGAVAPLLAPLLALGLALTPADAGAATIRASGLVVFGDSLSDPGNAYRLTGGSTPPSPPYFEGRFSNGYVWADHVADDFRAAGRPASNFAFGGSLAVRDIPLQIGAFAATERNRLGDAPAAAIWGGNNDLFEIVDNRRIGRLGRSFADSAARAVARSIGDSTRALARLGIDDFVIFNAPDLGLVPRYVLNRPGSVAAATRASEVFNAALASTVAGLRADGLNVVEIDVFSHFRALVADPAAYGITDPLTPCLVGLVDTCSPDEAARRAFFDNSHPTETIHAQLADIVRGELGPVGAPMPVAATAGVAAVAPVPLPAPALMLVTALAGLGLAARRRRPA